MYFLSQHAVISDNPIDGIIFNQGVIENLHLDVDLNNPLDVFGYVFHRLPPEVIVYPSENYYYFESYLSGLKIRGSVQIPANTRDEGIISFHYSEIDSNEDIDFEDSIQYSVALDINQGVLVQRTNNYEYVVTYGDTEVQFILQELEQKKPLFLSLFSDEVFVEKTFDESGYQFVLIYNTLENEFLWVLNEEEYVPDRFASLGDNLIVGGLSGFVFWIDRENNDRKILVGVQEASQYSNNYYDGPFDQLADNEIDLLNRSDYMRLYDPLIVEGIEEIDKYGYYNDSGDLFRVSISPYLTYADLSDIEFLLTNITSLQDIYNLI